MRYSVDPRQQALFDPAENMFSPMTIQYLRSDWPGIFRAQMLHLMPAQELGKHFHPTAGCHTKELYAMAGVIFLKEYFDLTIPDAVAHYLTDAAWQYALNVNPITASMSHATIERYTGLFVEDDLGTTVFHRVAGALIEALELDVSRQRLDSTHIESDMATFGRTKLMGVTIKRFLTQLKRHELELYDALPQDLRARYAPAQAKLFGDFTGERKQLRHMVAQDLLLLASRFSEAESVNSRTSDQALCRVLQEQCDVVEETVTVKAKTGGNVMQNPSDQDASYDGHKGPGHQVQIAETCSPDNDVQLITGVTPEPAHRSDQDAMEPMLDQLESHERVPEVLYADGQYGSDENVTRAAERGVDVQSPVCGSGQYDPQALTVDDFVINETTETVERCPNGCTPVCSVHDETTGVTTTLMAPSDCSTCAFRGSCVVEEQRRGFVLKHTAKQRRLAARRAEQATEAFHEHYSIRSGGESVNSALKRKTGFGRLRVRGSPRVRLAVMLRCAGWNLFRALSVFKKRGFKDFVGNWAAFSSHGRLDSPTTPPTNAHTRRTATFLRVHLAFAA